ncbi:uncharacterized protein [Dysidea avara]|uniref:uncharacterized protein isoform X2 n=1 Tax=Dysidea avara TaxID=196820 RepID=UPI003329A312
MEDHTKRPESFMDAEEEKTVQLSAVLSRVINITVVEEDGQIEGRLVQHEDDDKFGRQSSSTSSIVTGMTACSPGQQLPSYKNEANELNRRLAQNNNVAQKENVPQRREQQNMEMSLRATNLDTNISTPVNEQLPFGNMIDPHQQGEGSDVVKPMAGPLNIPASLKSDVSKSASAHSKLHHTSSVSTGKAVSERGLSGVSQTVVQSNRHSMELSEKRRHTLHCALHNPDLSNCKFYQTAVDCSYNYDKEFSTGLKQLLTGQVTTTDNANNEEQLSDLYMEYIVEHLQRKKCPSFCAQLWKYCVVNELYEFMQYAGTDFLVYSIYENRKDKVGTICKTYSGYKNMPVLGTGGFGQVYKYTSGSGPRLAIKEETKRPLIIGNLDLFKKVINLKHPHVIEMLEYVVGPCDKDGNQYYLFVMPFMNQRGFDEQFKEKNLKCVLDYMALHQHSIEFVFRNYTVSFRHVFEGLSYLEDQGIVHRDVKASNILVHQSCKCSSPLLCKCPGDDGGVVYVLGDLDLLCLEEKCSPCPYDKEYWEKMARHDPAGTMGMKPPESFFRTGEGELVVSHRSDVWSGCVTMMDILVGKGTQSELHKEAKKLIEVTTESAKGVTQIVSQSSNIVTRIIDTIQTEYKSEKTNEVENNVMTKLLTDLEFLQKLLDDGTLKLCRLRSFQGGESEVYEEECPLAGILNTAYRAHNLQWVCLSKLRQMYNTALWVVLLRTLDVIASGVRLLPEKRQDASAVVNALQSIYPKK